MKDPYSVINYPKSTEKAVRLMESENKLVFAVAKDATKKEIKEALESIFEVKVVKVNTTIMPTGKKKAYVKLSNETPAIDIATKMGML
ncbi:50S ribosomal protein L23 [Candidatus Woesearchaeota archaeon]|jgi:large subunit ribosomal protein L23|nr:50S ribosomal protein L23 [Candidatus Woesearchaeota archaeon]MBT5215114.1 50S ribosomal protein L23 [Candidatus Woesearchaeota archaeon]MBT6402541.1 50S ribosomal protein L23 [Candidatus Woesearchaeota archaeon]